MGFEPVRSSQSIADRFRSIHMVLFDRKRNFSGPPLGGLAKNESKLDHFKWFDVCPDATLCIVSILAVSGSQGARFAVHPVRPGRAARRYIARPRSPVGRQFHSSQVLHNISLSIGNRKTSADLPHVSDDDPLVQEYIEIGHL